MKTQRSLKTEMIDLITGNKEQPKKPGLLAFKRRERPGLYEVNGKFYNEAEFELLKQDYQDVIIFASTENDNESDKNNLNIVVDCDATAETFLKLRNIK